MKTLKQLHEMKSIYELRSKISKVDKLLINEQKHQNLVLEAFDKDKMKLAGDLIQKLNSINFGAMKTLSNAKNLAIKDCKESLNGPGVMQKIINLFKDKQTNPLADAVALCDALFNFFSIFPETIKSLNSENKTQAGGMNFSSDSTLGSLFGDKEDDEFDAFAKAVKNKDPKALTLQKVITTGFKPDKLLASIGKNYFTKYLNGKSGMQSLTSEMLNMRVSELMTIAESVTSALKNAEVVSQAISGAVENTSKSSDSTSSAPSTSSDSSKTSKETTSAATSPGAKVDKTDLVKSSYEKISDELTKSGIDQNTALRVLKTLSKHDKLK